MDRLENALRGWLTDNGYIGEGWRFGATRRAVVGISDIAEIYCEAYAPRKRKPIRISLRYNFVREQILTNTIHVAS